jgi:hypothetical protein
MPTQRKLSRIVATLTVEATTSKNTNKTPFVSVMATQANGKARRLMTYSKQGMKLLKSMKVGEPKALFGHFGTEAQDGTIQSRGVFFPIGESTPREVASEETPA